MKLFYFASTIPNFGDELNPWLWPQLFPGIFEDEPNACMFVGIGTLLNVRLPRHPRTVIFGTGCGLGRTPSPVPKSWKIYGVRGPLSAHALGLPKEASLGDGAILVRTLPFPKVPIIHVVSFMPHLYSAVLGKWPEACRAAGIHFIDPRWPVERVLQDIRSSGQLITSALHGAIVADALRIPWVPARPFSPANCSKWFDWAGTLDLNFRFTELATTTPDEIIHDRCPNVSSLLQRLQRNRKSDVRPPSGKVSPLHSSPFVPSLVRNLLIPDSIDRAAASLLAAQKQPACLSRDSAIDRVTNRLLDQFDQLRRDHAAGILSAA